MPYNFFRPKPGRFGVHTITVNSEKIGTITSASTDTFRFPTPYRLCYFLRASAQAQTAPVVTTGTSTGTIKKLVANGGATKTLSAGLDLETLTANKSKVFGLASGLAEADRFIRQDSTNGGDTLFIDVVNGTTIATQPVAMYFVIELLVIE